MSSPPLDLDARNPEMKEASEGQSKGYWRSVWKNFRRHKPGMVGLVFFLGMVLTAVGAPLLAGSRPLACSYQGRVYFPAFVDVLHEIPFASRVYPMPKPFRFPQFNPKAEILKENGDWAVWPPVPFDPLEVDPGQRLAAPSNVHRLGTDEVGRDVLSRMIHATSIAVMVGFISMGIAGLIGLVLGALAGYHGGWVDMIISRFIEIVICFPTFFLILSVMIWLDPDIKNVMVVIGITGWTGIARLVRGEFLRLKTLDYSVAARALGASSTRVVFRHLLPNGLTPVMVVLTFGVAGAIFTESGLSWLGFGVMPPTPSWGNILRAGWDNLRVAPHLIFPPCIAIFFAVLMMNLMGDALRDVTDPRLTGSA